MLRGLSESVVTPRAARVWMSSVRQPKKTPSPKRYVSGPPTICHEKIGLGAMPKALKASRVESAKKPRPRP